MARILFVIWKLGGGGAERQVVNLAKGLDRVGHEVAIAAWWPGGSYENEIEGTSIRFEMLRKPRFLGTLGLIRSARALAARFRPHVIHGYLETGNFLAAFMRSPEPASRVVWGVRTSALDLSKYDRDATLLYQINRGLSWCADLVIANSRSAAEHAASQHYPRNRLRVVYNGIDTGYFRHDAKARARMRAQWGVGPGERVIGLAARLDPVKGHETFIAAAQLLVRKRANVRFACVGEGGEVHYQPVLAALNGAGLGDRLAWHGHLDDMPAFYSALDVATSTSRAESFSNAIAEAMACGIPCVVTDVGDSAQIVGTAGIVVPASDPGALAAAWEAALDGPVHRPRTECVERIVELYNVARLVAETEAAILPLDLRLAPPEKRPASGADG